MKATEPDDYEISSALAFIPADDRETWVRMGMAVKSIMGDAGFPLWNEWSQSGSTYKERDARDVWKSIAPHGPVTVASLFAEAKANGYASQFKPKQLSPEEKARRKAEAERAEAEKLEKAEAGAAKAQKLWDAADDCKTHPYLTQKRVGSYGLRVINDTLLIPGRDGWGKLWSVTRVFLEDGEWVKKWLAGTAATGVMHWMGGSSDTIFLVEGYATGASLYERHGNNTFVGFSANNLVSVAKTLHECLPGRKIIVAGDLGEGEPWARKAALACNGTAVFPDFPPGVPGNDFNDLYNSDGGSHG